KAFRIQEKVKGIGFDFPDKESAWQKVEEELSEFSLEEDLGKKQEKLGDVFFSLINYARIAGINADEALEKTNQKFTKRFQKMEVLAKEKNTELSNMSLDKMDELWEEAKQSFE